MTSVRGWSFAKGHGTENDFVLVVDRENMHPVSSEQVVRICDRRAGIGADGLLRAVLAKHIDGWDGDGNLWFMDYRNRDGSIAEMCGNGIRVFARYLADESLAYGPVLPIATRAGLREAEFLADGRIRVAMGPVVVAPQPVRIVTSDSTAYEAVAVDVGNPHAVSFVDDVGSVPLSAAPDYPAEAFPDGVNAEFVQVLRDRHLAMRVYERGSGETASCARGPSRRLQPPTPARRPRPRHCRGRVGPVPRRRAGRERRGGTRRPGVPDRAGGARRPRCYDDPGMTIS